MPQKKQQEFVKVAFLPASTDACALYRMFIPHLNLPGSRFLYREGALDSSHVEGCQVAVVQRQVSYGNLHAMHAMKEAGLKVVYDLDDDIWRLPDWNPGKQIFTENIEGFKMCASEADILTVSTRGLKRAAEQGFELPHDIEIVPNAIDFNLFNYKEIARNDDKVLIGWGGSNTHSEDVKEAFDTVCDVLDMNENAYMEIVGAPAVDIIDKWEDITIDGKPKRRRTRITTSSKIAKHPQSRFRPWVPVGEFPNRFASWGWDIALAPLADHKFNRSKSNIKMLEAAAMKIPCLVSDIQPYNEFASLGGDDLKWLLCTTSNQWKNKLHELINNSDRRRHIGELMYEVAYKYFNAAVLRNNWDYTFRKVLGLVPGMDIE